MVRGSWRPNITATYNDPHSYGHRRCVFHVLMMLNRRPGGPPLCWALAFSTTSCLWLIWSPTQSGAPRAPSTARWLSLPHLIRLLWSPTHWGSWGPLQPGVAFPTTSYHQLTDFLSSPSYIIVLSPTQSPTQSLKWHVWSSSSGNNCHAVYRSLSSGASVYECIMGFYLDPFRQLNPPTQFLSITGHWNVSLPSSASLWNDILGRVEGKYTTFIAMLLLATVVNISMLFLMLPFSPCIYAIINAGSSFLDTSNLFMSDHVC